MTLNRSLRLGVAMALLSLVPAAGLLCWTASGAPGAATAPKRLLVVSTTLGFRHSSIEVGEEVLRELARRSGEFTLEFASVSPNDPKYATPKSERAQPARGRPGGFGPGMILAPAMAAQADTDGDKRITQEELAALADTWFNKLDADQSGKIGREPFASRLGDLLPQPGGAPRRAAAAAPKPKRRRSAPPLNLGLFVGPGLFAALDADKDGSLTREEMKGAFSRWAVAWDTDRNGSLTEAEIRDGLNAALPRPAAVGGFERNARADAAVREVLAEKMSPQALKRYDGVVFLNTTGDLPFPDPQAFYQWVEDGHAVVGMHAAADTLHGDPRYARMLGGEFSSHGAQVEVNVLNADPAHPATAGLGRALNLFEEVYLFKNYDRTKVHDLLVMDEHPNTEEPGHYPVSWVKEHGRGRVFYTSLGHREDVWSPTWKDRAGKRENPPAVAEAYQKHLLGGIRWALGLAQVGARPRDGAPKAAQGRRGGGRLSFDAAKTAAALMVSQGDKDGDGKLTRSELTALAGAWFDKLDPDATGKLTSERFGAKFGDLLPREEQGFGPALFLAPGLFAAADIDKDGLLSRAELVATFGRWFDRWDARRAGALDREALRAGLRTAWPSPRFRPPGGGRGRLAAEAEKGADFSEKPPIRPIPPDEEARRFLLPKGYKLELVLSEPDVEEPVAIAFDGNGRMYVAEMRTYMQDIDGKGEHDPVSRVSRHEDTDGDGRYDRHTVFIDKMVLPRFVTPWDGDSILSMETDADDVFKYTDTDGDGVADKKERFCEGVGRRGNLEHQQSGMVWGLDNRLYTTYNAFRLRWTPRGVLREPTAPNGGQWGLAQDDDGKMWFVDGGGERGPLNFQVPIHYGAVNVGDQFEEGFEVTWPAAPGHGDVQGGMLRVRLPEQTLNHFTAACGQEIFRGHRLPEDLRGDLLFAEPVGRLVRRAKVVVADGLTQLRNAYPKSEFIRSTDPLFRPVNLANAPDGTLYLVDMYRGIIQEGTWVEEGSYLRKKVQQYGLDKVVRHGRIWRLTYEGLEPDRRRPRMHDETPAQLVHYLEHPSGWWRDSAQRLLVLCQDQTVVPALQDLARTAPGRLTRVHALWTLEGLGALDDVLVREALCCDDPKMRVQAIRLSESLSQAGDTSLASDVRAVAKDADPGVAIQALLTLNLLKAPDAAALIRATADASRSRGVREIGNQLLQPQDGQDQFPPFRYTDKQRKLLTRGATIYRELCISCHGRDGRGAPLAGAPEGTTMAPPLAGSNRVQGHRDYTVRSLLHGLVGPVEGKSYPSLMAPMGSNDDGWIAAVASYVRNSFGNSAAVIPAEDVATIRAASAGRSFPWTVEELEATLPGFLRYRPDWAVTASHNPEFAGFAINSPVFVYWDSGASQQPGMWFQVGLPRPVTLGEIILDAPGGFLGGGYPRGYKVQVSMDGTSWGDPVAEGEGSNPSTRIAPRPVPARWVRVTLTEKARDGASWSIQKMRLFEAAKPPGPESQAPRVGTLPPAEVLDAVAATRGDARRGAKLFTDLSCVACHTVGAGEPARGPFLGDAARTYRRRELTEQILRPSKQIAKGYDTHLFALKDGRRLEGFVVRETPEALTIRTGAAEEHRVPVAEIEERGKVEKSLMPEGLVANLTVADLASLLDYLEGLSPASPGRPKP
jgi:putative heme-binding domain-containing protein